MKVIFKVVRAGSGNDIYFERLVRLLREINIDSEIEYYPKMVQFFPWILLLFNKRNKGDIVHSNVEYGWVFKEKNKPLIVTLHHNMFENEYRKSTSWKQKIFHDFILKPNIKKSLEVANKIIAVSNFTKQSYIKKFGNYDIDVIYNFIDTDKFKPKEINSTDKRFRLLFVGNLTKRKGADLLPQIMSGLGKDYILYYTSGLRTEIPKTFDLPNMMPLGKLSEEKLIEAYNTCDALLFPTRLEGFGYAIAEAMACGKQVIASNNSSIPELVTNGENGFLCKTTEVEEFIKEIRSIAKYKIDKSKIELNNRKKIINHFSLTSSIPTWKELYKS